MADLSSLADLQAAAPQAQPVHERKVDAQGRSYATGKRKNAIARVWVKPGSGKITVNGRDVTTYFARPVLRMLINQPFAGPVRHRRHRHRWWAVGPGRRPAPRHQPCPDLLRPGHPPGAEGWRLPHPRSARGRA